MRTRNSRIIINPFPHHPSATTGSAAAPPAVAEVAACIVFLVRRLFALRRCVFEAGPQLVARLDHDHRCLCLASIVDRSTAAARDHHIGHAEQLVRRRERAVRYPKCWARLCPTAISGNQWQSVAISGNQWQSVAISGNPWRACAQRHARTRALAPCMRV